MTQKLFTKNFTLLLFGQISSLFGNFILRFALSMYVLEATGSAAIFAGILAFASIPTILLSPLGGILADRANRRNIMVALDASTGLSVLFAALFFSKATAIPVISVLLVILSILGAFETPTVQSCIPQMLTGDNILKGNALVNQIAALIYMIAPILGSILYVAFGLQPVMYASILCFFATAVLECFIQLSYVPADNKSGILSIIKHDFSMSMRFLCKEEQHILKLLLLVACSRFFVMGTAIVGLPYIVRTILGLSAGYYGAAESALGIATIIGSIAAGLLIGKLHNAQLAYILALIGACLIPAGIAFLLPSGIFSKYIINVLAFCGVQIAAGIFSIFSVSYIQQKTPNHMIGKVMAYTSAITMCAQPIGQAVYGLLFDTFRGAVYLILIPTGVIACLIGLFATAFFKSLEP